MHNYWLDDLQLESCEFRVMPFLDSGINKMALCLVTTEGHRFHIFKSSGFEGNYIMKWMDKDPSYEFSKLIWRIASATKWPE